MGCGSCGTSGGGCSSGGCGKMDVHDWLGNMSLPEDQKYTIIEVSFKGGRKGYYRNVDRLDLVTGDNVVIEASPGHHIGQVSLQGELVRLQVRKRKITNVDELPVIYRLASERDLEKYKLSQERESPTLFKSREIIKELGLEMKLSDLEFQADNTKATFFYSADERVDFRELIKRLAGEFRVRVEMRQISLRQEAGRLGGIGSCGRELCCSTWLTEFKSVSTSAARYQNLSLNPSKLSGQCGRLKCCLNYELETYLVELENIPEIKAPLLTERGEAQLQKTDIFKKMMWFGYNDDNNWHEISVERVNEILKLNAKGEKPYSLESDDIAVVEEEPMNNDLLQLDKRLNRKGTKKSNSRNRNKKGNNNNKKHQNNNSSSKNNKSSSNQNKSSNNKRKNNNKGNNNPNNKKEQQGQKKNVVVKRKSVVPNKKEDNNNNNNGGTKQSGSANKRKNPVRNKK